NIKPRFVPGLNSVSFEGTCSRKNRCGFIQFGHLLSCMIIGLENECGSECKIERYVWMIHKPDAEKDASYCSKIHNCRWTQVLGTIDGGSGDYFLRFVYSRRECLQNIPEATATGIDLTSTCLSRSVTSMALENVTHVGNHMVYRISPDLLNVPQSMSCLRTYGDAYTF